MSSFTKILKQKRSRKHARAGRARKAKMSRASTKSYADLFGACGEPGQKAPAADKAATANKA